ncbi:MAG: helix-turn-helix transcriptional regulator [Muribaculaceae bacterium]|nr:helix-turn-helix transcriptional regulator [Muribaculaceae bacterium]
MENQKYRSLKTNAKFGGRTYFCALELALELIGGKWKSMMLYQLKNGPLRSSDLQRRMRDISNKMFTQTARSLERDGLIQREVFPVVPPRVEYSLTGLGESAIPVIMQMGYWGEEISTFD